MLDHGHVIAEGTPSELKSRLGTTVLALTFADHAGAVRGLDLIRDLSDKPANTDGVVIELTINSGPAVAAEAIRRLDGAGIMILGLTLREPSLDDVFLELTGHKAEDATAELATAPAGRRGRS